MGFTFKRFVSSKTISAKSQSLAQRVFDKYYKKPLRRSQLLDSNQLQRMSLTLGRPNLYTDLSICERELINGTPLPPGYHLAYFTPAALPHELGRDGTDVAFSPEHPFTRRMWAGGEVRWIEANPLRIGDIAVETTRVLSAEPKMTRVGEEMILVGIEKTFENAHGVALVDRRDWVFRAELKDTPTTTTRADLGDGMSGFELPDPRTPEVKVRDFCQSPVDLFRFSALTFNAHKIHYSQPWCRKVEGHRDVVVHGPLNLINMLDFWRDTRKHGDYGIPRSIRYRATAPFYGDEKYRALLEEGREGAAHVKLWGHDGNGNVRVGMMGDIVAG